MLSKITKLKKYQLVAWEANVCSLQALSIESKTNLNYWFRILSILERTKNSTKTSNTSFERSDSGLLKSFIINWTFYEKGAWQAHDNAMPLSSRNIFVHYQGFQKRYCMSLYHIYFSSKLTSNFKEWIFFWLYIINQNVFRTLNFELNLKDK